MASHFFRAWVGKTFSRWGNKHFCGRGVAKKIIRANSSLFDILNFEQLMIKMKFDDPTICSIY